MNKKSIPKKSDKGLLKAVLTSALIFGGAFAYYRTTQNKIIETQNSAPQAVAKRVELPESQTLDGRRALRLHAGASCEGDMVKVCQMLGLNRSKLEGFTTLETSLVGFVNLEDGFKDTAPAFEALNMDTKREILLLKHTLKRDFLQMLRRNNTWSAVQIIGFTVQGDQVNIHSLLKIKRDYDLEAFSANTVNAVLNETLNFGNLDALDLMKGSYEIVHFNGVQGPTTFFGYKMGQNLIGLAQ